MLSCFILELKWQDVDIEEVVEDTEQNEFADIENKRAAVEKDAAAAKPSQKALQQPECLLACIHMALAVVQCDYKHYNNCKRHFVNHGC